MKETDRLYNVFSQLEEIDTRIKDLILYAAKSLDEQSEANYIIRGLADISSLKDVIAKKLEVLQKAKYLRPSINHDIEVDNNLIISIDNANVSKG